MKLKIQLLIALLSLTLIAASAVADEQKKVDVTSPNAIRVTLQDLVGKSVTLKLRGSEVSGKVAAVGDTFVHIATLANGMEFFDAVVRIESVEALVYRAK